MAAYTGTGSGGSTEASQRLARFLRHNQSLTGYRKHTFTHVLVTRLRALGQTHTHTLRGSDTRETHYLHKRAHTVSHSVPE